MKNFSKKDFEREISAWQKTQARLSMEKQEKFVDRFAKCSSRALQSKEVWYKFWNEYFQNGMEEARLNVLQPPKARKNFGIAQMVVGSLSTCAGVVIGMSKTHLEICAVCLYAGVVLASFGASNAFTRGSEKRYLKSAIKKQSNYTTKLNAINVVKSIQKNSKNKTM